MKPPNSQSSAERKISSVLQLFGTLTMTLSLATLYISILTPDWLTLQEPILDPTELEKLGPYDDDPKPHLLKAKLGLFRTCTAFKLERECVSFDFRRFLDDWELFEERGSGFSYGGSELVIGCVNRVRLTLPFILSSVFFTSMAFFTLLFGTFCNKNKKIIEASLLILAGLCQATALLTFVSQIGSEFESNNFYPSSSRSHSLSPLHTTPTKLSSHYRYKYGYSFYLFLLSFSLSELAALFDMAAYFKKQRKTEGEGLLQEDGSGSASGPNQNGRGVTDPSYGMDTLSDYKQVQHPDICEFQNSEFIIPQESYFMSPEVVVVQQQSSYYGTGGRKPNQAQKLTSLESFATMGRGVNGGRQMPMQIQTDLNRL